MTQTKMAADVTGLILSGGRGSRMDNVDKGLQLLDGVPLTQRVLARLAPQVGHVAISANRNLDEYGRFCVPVWPDDMPDYAGPLAGLQAGLARCETQYLATVPCDSPFLPLDLIERLMQALISNGADLAYAVTDGDGEKELRAHPVFALMRAGLLPSLTAYLQSGGRKVRAWQATLNSLAVHFPDSAAFRNINSRGDLRALEGVHA
jgi:molybdenum cofactor guanylyltransferase